MKSVTSVSGVVFKVDTTAEACRKFGFLHGDNIFVIALGIKGVVIGVAPLPGNVAAGCVDKNTDVLWVTLEGEEGIVKFFPDPSVDFKKMRTVLTLQHLLQFFLRVMRRILQFFLRVMRRIFSRPSSAESIL